MVTITASASVKSVSSDLQYAASNTHAALLQGFSLACSLEGCSHLGKQKKQTLSPESGSLQAGGKGAGELYEEVEDSQQSFGFFTVES